MNQSPTYAIQDKYPKRTQFHTIPACRDSFTHPLIYSSTQSCKTNPISPRNLSAKGADPLRWGGLIHPFTHQPIYFFIQNEPNLTTNAPTNHAKDTNFTTIIHSFLQLSIRQMRTFTKKSKKYPPFVLF